ncbi:MAG: C40 family peptidase [Candidatus Azobacteroides sp.]|nr:C40 family peptidase [Candidatus Azobacteroides sp.]
MNLLILRFLILIFGVSYCSEEEKSVYPLKNHIFESEVKKNLTIDNEKYGVITVSVADAKMDASYSAEPGTQLLLGMPVEIIQHKDWWQIKTPEGYIAWIEKSAFVRMNKETFNQWISAKKVIFTDDYGFAYEMPDEQKQRASDLVFGNILKWEGESKEFFRVSYPDGRKAYVLKKQALLYDKWKASVRLSERNIVQTALTLKGIPYSWGGTSVKEMDCSGFVKTVFLKNGIILRRDAWQQAQTGIPVDISARYDNLRPGDLMFFGKKATNESGEKIRHVAIYIGNKEFIHASGYVRINSLDPKQPNYDEENTREFIHASRIIGAVGTEGIWNIADNPLYRIQE